MPEVRFFLPADAGKAVCCPAFPHMKKAPEKSSDLSEAQIKIIFPLFMRYAKYSCARRAASLMQSRSWSSVSNFLLGLR